MNALSDPRAQLAELDEPAEGALTLRYAPAQDSCAEENPPRFAWLPELDSDAHYCLRLRKLLADPAAASDGSAHNQLHTRIARNYFTPPTVLLPGLWAWAYAVCDAASGEPISAWSSERRFEVTAGLPECPGMPHENRWAHCDETELPSHPRLWMNASALVEFRQRLQADPDHCSWQQFMRLAVTPWLSRELIAEPAPYPANRRDAALWRASYIACQEVLYAVRHLSIAARVLQDAELLQRAREWLLHVARWDPRGSTAREYNDEASFRVAQALAWGYDWLHDALSEAERAQVRAVLVERSAEIARHIIERARIHVFPLDSHAVRGLGSVLLPCGIVLRGEPGADSAEGWLDYAVDFYDGPFPPWGGAQGGWAEGPQYWSTAMSVLLEAGIWLRNYAGHDLFRRPFAQRTGDYILYTRAPDTRRASFCDDSTLGELPSLKLAFLMRAFAGINSAVPDRAAQAAAYQWYFEQIRPRFTSFPSEFYEYGWWDFSFDEMLARHSFPACTAAVPDALPRVADFRDIGWVAIQQHMADPQRHIQFITKASAFGSISHSHADQGAFTLFAFGEELAIHSGHYIAHNSSMHRNWRRQTRSKNALLINGRGQYAGEDKMQCRRASGRVLDVIEGKQAVVISLDPTEAYRETAPELQRWQRDVHFVHGRYFVIVDQLTLSEPGTVQWLLHTHGEAQIAGQSLRYEGVRAGMTGEFVFCSAGRMQLRAQQGFADVDAAEITGLEQHWQVIADTPQATRHQIVSVLVPYRIGERERVQHFIDDQGFAINLYFQDAGDALYRISLPKQF